MDVAKCLLWVHCTAEEISEGLLDSWINGKYEGETNSLPAAMHLLKKWNEIGTPIDSLDPEVLFPKVPTSFLLRDPHSLLAGAERTPSPYVLPKQYFCDMKTGQEFQKDADPRWGLAWEVACKELSTAQENLNSQSSGKSATSILAYLYNRLGFECGTFMRILHRKCNASWGTYQDAICHESDWHCNAHANNLAVLSPGHSDYKYLSYLDLDMAFDKETPTLGHNHLVKWDKVQRSLACFWRLKTSTLWR